MRTDNPSDLTAVVREIVEALLRNDWSRYSDDEGRFYYVIREIDHSAEILQHRSFDNTLIFERSEPNYFEEWYIRAALAEAPPDHLAKARKRVAAAGIDVRFFDDIIRASRMEDSPTGLMEAIAQWLPHFMVDDRLEMFRVLVDAIRVDRTRTGQLLASQSGQPTLHRAIESLFLRELAERLPKVVKRASSFDWLSFGDPSLREACRCYLYGFFRAALLMAAAALEARLKENAEIARLESYDALVDKVFGIAGSRGHDGARAQALKNLFELRNRVAHDGVEPEAQEVGRYVELTRDTLELLTGRIDKVG